MFHEKRIWCVAPAESAEEVATKLTEQTWTLCTAFELAGCVFLNDSTSEDGAQEYAVITKNEGGGYEQIESITFGWCTYDEALEYVKGVIKGEVELHVSVTPELHTPDEHGSCELCR